MAEKKGSSQPVGVVTQLVRAMPRDTNPFGDIFGGWLMSQMDIAGGSYAERFAKGRSATVAVKEMTFHEPVMVGDLLACYCSTERVGRTSLTVKIEAWVLTRAHQEVQIKVTEGVFTYVAVDENRKPRPLPPEAHQS